MKIFFFGPVLSRRLNFSLGIDILPYEKTCTFDCLYCEIGKTKQKIDPNMRSPFYSDLKKEFESQLRNILSEAILIDSLTFAGYMGEPTLNSELDSFLKITKQIRAEFHKENIPISILTNSSTINNPEIRQSLTNFDQIIAKLDAGDQEFFTKVNRPHYLVSPISEIINGLLQLKKELKNGKLIIQTLLFNENFENKNIDDLIIAYNTITPDAIQLYSIARLPAYSVKRINSIELEQIMKNVKGNLDNRIKIQIY